MENDILFKLRMADRSSVKFILKNKRLYISVGSEEIGVDEIPVSALTVLYEKFSVEYSTALDTYANHIQKDMKSDCSDREFEKMKSVVR